MPRDNEDRALTDDERTALRVMLGSKGHTFTFCLLAAKSGVISREGLVKQNASADFIAEYERMEVGGMGSQLMKEAWQLGFRLGAPITTKSNDEGK